MLPDCEVEVGANEGANESNEPEEELQEKKVATFQACLNALLFQRRLSSGHSGKPICITLPSEDVAFLGKLAIEREPASFLLLLELAFCNKSRGKLVL
jgi:hypothetical protein